MNISEVTLFVRSDVIHDGFDEDGSPIFSESFYVVAEDTQGYRLAHFAQSTSPEAVDKLKELLLDIKELDHAFWTPIDPAYGSVAYTNEEPRIVAEERARG